MPDPVKSSLRTPNGSRAVRVNGARIELPSLWACGLALLSAILLILSFPDFDLWPLAWISLVPLLVAIARRPARMSSFLLGWLMSSLFFYVSCHWVTFSMINYGGIPAWLAYLLLIPGAVTLGALTGAFALVLAVTVRMFRAKALLLAPFIWVIFEWLRLEVTGQLWNAIGYSQAYKPYLIQSARWGGVYAIGFLIVAVNAAVAFALMNRGKRAIAIAASEVCIVALVVVASAAGQFPKYLDRPSPSLYVLAVQPDVPMDIVKTTDEMNELTMRHLVMSETALQQVPKDETPRLIVWPESPMNFSYADDLNFQDFISRFARKNNAAVLFNSQEPAANKGIYNSALLVNQQGRLVGQYDKIRLLPFGEYVPLPRWVPGSSLITAIVGDFSPGSNYRLLSAGGVKVGVFICIESAYPEIARSFAREGADVLINISNDGYLGRTAVMRQHLANAVFRAVENGRPLLRVTNTGISAYITSRGEVKDQTASFEPASRVWTVSRNENGATLYTRFGDAFVLLCAVLLGLVFIAGVVIRNRAKEHARAVLSA